MVEIKTPVVTITGVTGYLGSYVLHEFLNGEGRG
jgi:thioester reductase-like protein